MKLFPVITLIILTFLTSCEIMPRNTISDCREQCKDNNKSNACLEFCDCIHIDGRPLDSCLDAYDRAPVDSLMTR